MNKIPPELRKKLAVAAGGSAVAIAAVLGAWYEGDGPTKVVNGVTYHVPYMDPVGILTVCRGITGQQVIKGKLYTRAECEALEHQHLKLAEAAARRNIKTFDRQTVWARAALIDWFYNLGENEATKNSTLVRNFNAGDTEGGCRQLAVWVKGRVKGVLVTLKGLVARRDTEMELCLQGLR